MMRIGILGLFSLLCGCAMNRTDLPDIDKLWDYHKPEETEKKFRELLSAAEESGNTGYQAELLTQIARTHSLRSRFDEAHRILDQVEKMLTPDLPRARVRYLLERGRSFNSSKQQDKARPLFHEAWDLAREAREDNLAVDAAHMIAIVEIPTPEKAMEWNLKALDYAEKSDQKDAKKWLGSLYNNIGWTYFDMKKNEDALRLFEKGVAFREEQRKDGPILIAKWCVARVYRALGRVEEALDVQRKLDAEYDEKKLDRAGYVYEELGECLLALKKDGYESYFAKA